MIRAPLYQEGQRVQVRNNDGKWVDVTITRVVPHYHYAVSFPPDKRFARGRKTIDA